MNDEKQEQQQQQQQQQQHQLQKQQHQRLVSPARVDFSELDAYYKNMEALEGMVHEGTLKYWDRRADLKDALKRIGQFNEVIDGEDKR